MKPASNISPDCETNTACSETTCWHLSALPAPLTSQKGNGVIKQQTHPLPHSQAIEPTTVGTRLVCISLYYAFILGKPTEKAAQRVYLHNMFICIALWCASHDVSHHNWYIMFQIVIIKCHMWWHVHSCVAGPICFQVTSPSLCLRSTWLSVTIFDSQYLVLGSIPKENVCGIFHLLLIVSSSATSN